MTLARLLCALGFHRWTQADWGRGPRPRLTYSAHRVECERCRVGRYT